ncbi:MarR family transcriptional regulator [Paenibacillus guangzhouensis]|uniref:MarR family transcriptional regulator n=1 Tax=Paenibacillus guangzhouensis TaxID=1473112 RepID=UPI0012676F01|nr:MarR family transcriptional regulator [Paenibacillus guangzhouensis]
MAKRENLIEMENEFRKFMRKVQSEWARNVNSELSRTQFLVLDKLYVEGPMKGSDIADAIYITAGAVTGCSDKLILGGYAERMRDERDRRVVYLKITEKGIKTLQEIAKRRQELMNDLFGNVSDEDVKRLTSIFKQVIENSESKE